VPRDAAPQAMRWPEFRAYFREHWSPGEHVAVVAPTGAGKTTFVGGILKDRRYVLAADPKGGDSTLAAMGFRRLDKWPGEPKMLRIIDEDERKGRASRFVVGPVVGRLEDREKLRKAISDSLDGAFGMGGWTYYLDELQVTADRRLMNLSGKVDNLLVSARDKGISVVLAFQQPKWVTSASLTQPTWIVTSYTRDRDTVARLSEILGRPRAEIQGALKGLDPYCWIVIGRDPRAPIIVTKPDRIAPRKAS
jgi:hypothetical protein